MESQAIDLTKKTTIRTDLELTGFRNVISVQQFLLTHAHNLISNPAPPSHPWGDARDVSSEEAFFDNNITKDDSLPQQATAEEKFDFIVQDWVAEYPASGLRRFLGPQKQGIQPEVLLIALQGLMTDCETLDCERVDLKWTSFLTGALIQSECCKREDIEEEEEEGGGGGGGGSRSIVATLKGIVFDLSLSQHKAIEQNKIISASTTKHQAMLEQTIQRVSVVSKQLAVISQDLRKSLIFTAEPIASSPRSSNVMVPRSSLQRKSFHVVHDGIRLTITLSPESTIPRDCKDNGNEESLTLSEASQDEFRQLLVSPLKKFTSTISLSVDA